MRKCELNTCERQRAALRVKALHWALEAQVALARAEAWRRSLQGWRWGVPGGKHTLRKSRVSNLSVTLPAKASQTNVTLSLLGFL